MVSMGKTIYYSCFILDWVGWVVVVLGNTMPRGLITFTSPPSPPILWWAQVISLKKRGGKAVIVVASKSLLISNMIELQSEKMQLSILLLSLCKALFNVGRFFFVEKTQSEKGRNRLLIDFVWSPKKACVALMFTLEILRSKYQTNNRASIFLTEWADYCIHSQKTLW